MSAAPKLTVEDLWRLGEDVRAELLDGVILPKAIASHVHCDQQGGICAWLRRRYHRQAGGRWPGGWWIDPEIHVIYEDQHVYCHDLAGWRRDRVPELPRHKWIPIMPDWVCELVSEGHEKRDRQVKFQMLHKHEVPHYWIVDPDAKILHAYRYAKAGCELLHAVGPGEVLRIEPFAEIELRTAVIFGDEDDEE